MGTSMSGVTSEAATASSRGGMMEAGSCGGCGDGGEKQADLRFGGCHHRTWAGASETRRQGRKKGQADLAVHSSRGHPPHTVVSLFRVSDGLVSIYEVRSGVVSKFG